MKLVCAKIIFDIFIIVEWNEIMALTETQDDIFSGATPPMVSALAIWALSIRKLYNFWSLHGNKNQSQSRMPSYICPFCEMKNKWIHFE